VASYFPNQRSQRTCFFRICNGDKVEPSHLPKDLIVKLHFQSNDLDGLLWQQRTSDRLHRALGRLQGLVARIRVSLDDINGPEGGVDKRCSVEIHLRGSSPVAVSATSRSWQDSVDAVATRIRQRVALQLHRATVVEHQSTTLAPVRARVGAPVAVAVSPRRLRLG
jgi:putative sigma-54 modulation protein